MSPRRPLLLSVALIAIVAASCGPAPASDDSVLSGIGRIPGMSAVPGASDSAPGDEELAALNGKVLGESATGNRLLLIGDSILAGTASRYGNEMCSSLVPRGWRVVVEAEAGQPASFGREVLRERLAEGWDAAVVLLGTNPSAGIERYRTDMERIVVSLAPRPTLLLTTTLFRASQKAVNDVIVDLAARHDNVSLLDWGTASTQPGVLNADGVHPTPAGRALLVRSVVAAVGGAPEGTGACLEARFTDDTRVSGATTTTSTSVPAPGASSTTVPVTAPESSSTTVPVTAPVAGATTTTRP